MKKYMGRGRFKTLSSEKGTNKKKVGVADYAVYVIFIVFIFYVLGVYLWYHLREGNLESAYLNIVEGILPMLGYSVIGGAFVFGFLDLYFYLGNRTWEKKIPSLYAALLMIPIVIVAGLLLWLFF